VHTKWAAVLCSPTPGSGVAVAASEMGVCDTESSIYNLLFFAQFHYLGHVARSFVRWASAQTCQSFSIASWKPATLPSNHPKHAYIGSLYCAFSIRSDKVRMSPLASSGSWNRESTLACTTSKPRRFQAQPPSLPLGCRVCCKGSVFQVVTLNGVCVGTQTGLSHNLTSMQISEWIELIQLLHIESFEAIVAEMRDRYQENIRNSSPVLIILNTLQVVQSVCLQGIELFGIVLTACMACAAKQHFTKHSCGSHCPPFPWHLQLRNQSGTRCFALATGCADP